MAEAHVCDECKTVAPIGEAIGWWSFESIEGIIAWAEKDEYHFCSWQCAAEYVTRHASLVSDGRSS